MLRTPGTCFSTSTGMLLLFCLFFLEREQRGKEILGTGILIWCDFREKSGFLARSVTRSLRIVFLLSLLCLLFARWCVQAVCLRVVYDVLVL